MKPYYLAGPMTGIPQFNFPAFHAAAADLRSRGYNIISPAEEDSPEIQAEALKSDDGKLVNGKIGGETWGQILARDVLIVSDRVAGIIFLPDWMESRGAKLEAFVGLLCNKQFALYQPEHIGGVNPVDRNYILAMIAGNT